MTQSYSPGLKVTRSTRYRSVRMLPISGDVLVKVGDLVSAEQTVARTELPGDALPLNLARRLGTPAKRLPERLLVTVGGAIETGQPIARSKGMFGWGAVDFVSPVTGTLESASDVTGQVILRGPTKRLEVKAYLTGKVVEVIPNEGAVIEGDVALIQGIFGIGGEAYGPLALVCSDPGATVTAEMIGPQHQGAILVGGARMTFEAVTAAQKHRVAALVTGGIDDQDLRDILGYDLGVAITGLEKLGVTLIVTEGFGDIPMASRTIELLKSFVGQPAAVNGATQIRAGVLRPEIIIPQAAGSARGEVSDRVVAGALEVGATVRLIRDPEFGKVGTISDMPHEPQVLASGSLARILQVVLSDGRTVTVPRANVELIAE